MSKMTQVLLMLWERRCTGVACDFDVAMVVVVRSQLLVCSDAQVKHLAEIAMTCVTLISANSLVNG